MDAENDDPATLAANLAKFEAMIARGYTKVFITSDGTVQQKTVKPGDPDYDGADA